MANESYLVICSSTLAGVGWLAKLAAFEKGETSYLFCSFSFDKV